ncbi:hypothetical protein ACHAWF_005666 [Thalassiosira exigua]
MTTRNRRSERGTGATATGAGATTTTGGGARRRGRRAAAPLAALLLRPLPLASLALALLALLLPGATSFLCASPRSLAPPSASVASAAAARAASVRLVGRRALPRPPGASSPPLLPLRAVPPGLSSDAARDGGDDVTTTGAAVDRRSMVRRSLAAAAATAVASSDVGGARVADAALGSLPEFADANAAFQSLTIDVCDRSQFDETMNFFVNSFDGMKVLRERNAGVRDAWLGFGPETLSIPSDFELPVSSLARYGGHASLHLRYDPSGTTALYKRSSGEFNTEPAPGDNIAYLQLGVPQYRISQMTKHGGNVLDAYGWVNVVSPAGLPVRAIVGIRADPMMFLAIRCADVAKSEEFYGKLGFVRQEYPYARLNQGQGQFEPPQPPGSVYVAPSLDSMGVLLLPTDKRGFGRKKGADVSPNPVLRSVNVVYAPSGGDDGSGGGGGEGGGTSASPRLADPSRVPISFVPQDDLEKEIRATAIPGSS